MSDSDASGVWQRVLSRPLIERIVAGGGTREWHLVGGVLRDAWLGRDSPDLDLVVAHGGADFAARLAAELDARLVRLGGERFAAYRLVTSGSQIDLWDREGGTLAADLERRDFTMNSMALEPHTGRLLDPHGGLADLAAGSLRATTARSFAEDPVRVLRLMRFAADLGLAPTPDTLELARGAVPALETAASERIREELSRALTARRPEDALELLLELSLFPALWGSTAAKPNRVRARHAGALDRLDRLAALGVESRPGERFALVQAVLFGEAATTPAAQDAGELVRRARRSRLLSGREAAAISLLLRPAPLPQTEPERRWFLHSRGPLWPAALALAGADLEPAAADGRWREAAERLAALASWEGESIFTPRPLLDGHALAQLLGIGEGPRLGGLRDALLRAQVEGRIATRGEAEALARKLDAAGDRPTTPSASG